MVRQLQGKIKGLKTDQFKKKPVIMDEEKKPEQTPEEKKEEEKPEEKKPEETSEEQPSS